MGAILMFNVVCTEDVIVTAGSFVTKSTQIPADKIVSGNPAQVIRDVLKTDIDSKRRN
jgi:acetyltransferase-like isoleucine patch superfamily enzyme